MEALFFLLFAPTRHCFPEQMNIVSYTEFPWKDVHFFHQCCHCSKHFIRFSFIFPLNQQHFLFNNVSGGKALSFGNKCVSLERAQMSTRCNYPVVILIFPQIHFRCPFLSLLLWDLFNANIGILIVLPKSC